MKVTAKCHDDNSGVDPWKNNLAPVSCFNFVVIFLLNQNSECNYKFGFGKGGTKQL